MEIEGMPNYDPQMNTKETIESDFADKKMSLSQK